MKKLSPSESGEHLRRTLRSTQLFATLDESLLEEIGSATRIKNVSPNELLFYEGDPAEAFYIVSQGRVRVYKTSAEGKEQILMIANEGESFGEAAVFAGGKFPASAQALTESEVVVVDRARFAGLIGKNPDLAMNLVARLSELLRKLTRLVEELSLTDVTTRLAHYLADQLKDDSADQELIIHLTEKKSTLASQLGTIPETLSRSLAKLSKEKVIAVDGSDIRVISAARLRELAGNPD
jgi:CRP-like cAMP-binding protein